MISGRKKKNKLVLRGGKVTVFARFRFRFRETVFVSARNTNIYCTKFAKFRHKLCHSINFKILFLAVVKDFVLLAYFDLYSIMQIIPAFVAFFSKVGWW